MDVIAGPYIYLGPTFDGWPPVLRRHQLQPDERMAAARRWCNLAYDWTGDGWPDVLNMSGNAGNGTGTLYVNPKGESRRWDSYVVMQPPDASSATKRRCSRTSTATASRSSSTPAQNTLRYSRPDPANPTGTWVTTTISEPGPWGVNISHGMGIGDINGDGLNDYVDGVRLVGTAGQGQRAGTLWK